MSVCVVLESEQTVRTTIESNDFSQTPKVLSRMKFAILSSSVTEIVLR